LHTNTLFSEEIMKRSNWKLLSGGLLLLGSPGCDSGAVNVTPSPDVRVDADGKDVDVKTPNRDIKVKSGPGGVDVDVNPGVDVDVKPGSVDVNIDGDAIREGIQERRAERAEERAEERADE
jgi:hypothetical protein